MTAKLNRFALAILLLIVLLPAGVSANLTLALDLEARIQEKLRSLIQPIDPYAQVLVTVRLKKLDLELPGTGGQTSRQYSTSSSAALSLDDVEMIDVSVISRLDPLPDSLKRILDSGLNVPAGQKHLTIRKMDAQTASLIHENGASGIWQAISDRIDEGNSTWKRFLHQLYFILGGILVGFAGLFVLRERRAQKFQSQAISRLVEGIKEYGSYDRGGGSRPIDVPSSVSPGAQPALFQGPPAGEEAERQAIHSLSTETLAALLSDCYWCEEDEYGAWLWTQMVPQQREQVLKLWPAAGDYVVCLAPVERKFANYHNHPYYLKPLMVLDISQADLSGWVKLNPGAWHYLSPMRQAKAHLPLVEKMNFSGAAPAKRLPALPAATQEPRALVQPIEIGNISEADEALIFENPDSIPVNLRSRVPSLVWTALLPKPERERILLSLSAEAIAEAWIGPEAILNRVGEAMPDKKLQLVREYGRRVRPSRTSSAMLFLVKESVSGLTAGMNSVVAEANDALNPRAA